MRADHRQQIALKQQLLNDLSLATGSPHLSDGKPALVGFNRLSGVSQVTDLPEFGTLVLRHLLRRWPETVNVIPVQFGINRGGDFLEVVHALTDSGLLSYEALISDGQGPRIVGAAITPRGRALVAAAGAEAQAEAR